MKKVLIFGPIADYGGRETEVAFIAEALSKSHSVDVFTTSGISADAHIRKTKAINRIFALKALVLNHSWFIRFLAYVSYIRNGRRGNLESYANNQFVKRFFDYPKVVNSIIARHLETYDVLVICAQLPSSYISGICSEAKKRGIPVIFRTTGTIDRTDFDYLGAVDVFLHHSEQNAQRLFSKFNHNYRIIDQCAQNEEALLEIPPMVNCNKFLVVSRLSPEKGVAEFLEAFVKYCPEDELEVAGNGPLLSQLKAHYASHANIRFLGFVPHEQIHSCYANAHFVVVPSHEETGPMSGIEAMAAGRAIISTKVGAMPDRLQGMKHQFWFDISDTESFANAVTSLRALSDEETSALSNEIRERYKQNYSVSQIALAYNEVVSGLI